MLWGAESIPSKMPLRNIWDFEGIKMRAPEGMGAAIWRKLESEGAVRILTPHEVRDVHGDGHIEAVTIEDTSTGPRWTIVLGSV